MLGQIMREANAMETLREHFHLDILICISGMENICIRRHG